jgi:thiamine-phosphate pyrophosphorylase
MKPKIDYTLYLVTNRELMSSASIEECVELAILGGCTVVQLREKTASSREFFNTAMRVREITARHGVPLIINDRADIALAVNADGLHIGQNDLPYEEARKILGAEKIIGVSANTLSRAKTAAEAGADYLGVGAMFSTGTKTDTITIDRAELERIREAVKIPIVAIGGINKNNVTQLRGTGINGIAVVSAVVAEKDITGAARNMKSFLKEEII